MIKKKTKKKRKRKPKSDAVHTSGKRKRAVARATIKPGTGRVSINSTPLDNYGSYLARMKIKEPLMIAADLTNKVDVSVNVKGGGWMSQAEAARLSIARGLLQFSGSKDLKSKFLTYDRYLLVADARATEPHKPCRSSARRGKQTSKR